MAASSRAMTWCRPMRLISSAYLLKITRLKSRSRGRSNLSGTQITNFLKQYSEFGLTFPVGGFGFDTALCMGRPARAALSAPGLASGIT